ncbi:ATP-binding protein [Sorangium sp. So ce185]|uniref:ATP-binding protein n=1 Tax=Sorangium sp. So ce185 TaxID=3133287 RepID=UPI003F5E7CAD
MPRWFNTAGPCNPADHYMLPPEERLPGVRDLIDRKAYFVLHAPRQIGKTTSLLTLAQALTREGRYVALLVSAEVGAPFPDDPGAAELAMLSEWRGLAGSQLPAELQPPPFPDAPPGQRIGAALRAWAQAAPRPLVVFLDEIDALRDVTLISVLRQLRSGYPGRPHGFPHALALIGLRDVRDYKVDSGGGDRLGTSSPFNIKVESLTLRNFTRDEVAALVAQHTAETGQGFQSSAVDRAFELTQGQPWLVNALARQLVDVLVKDRAQPITAADVDRAKEILIERQDTHLDSLVERLREPRIRAVIEPMLAGGTLGDVPEDDRRFAVDLGLVRRAAEGGLVIANPIYREIIVRQLTSGVRDSLPRIPATWLTPDGRLDADRLLDAFLSFWRQHGEPLLGAAPYHEIAPHLVVMAFLHRVVNGGGTIEREYAIGRGRMDLCVRYAGETLAIELKVWRDGRPDPLAEGLAQLDEYLAGLGLQRGWLILFDQRSGQPPIAERTRREHASTPAGREVVVIRA